MRPTNNPRVKISKDPELIKIKKPPTKIILVAKIALPHSKTAIFMASS